MLSLRVVTMEAAPRVLELKGRDLGKVMHAYGTNGIVTEVEAPLDAAYDWIDVIVGFDDYMKAVRFAYTIAHQDGLLFKEIATVAAPAPYDYFLRHQRFLKREHSVALLMVAPHAVDPFLSLVGRESWRGALSLRYGDGSREEGPAAGLRADLEPHDAARAKGRSEHHLPAGALPLSRHRRARRPHDRDVRRRSTRPLEFIRFDGNVVATGLPIVRFTSEERLDEIVRLHEDNGCPIFNPHRYTLEEGGMKRTDAVQLAFKKEADPKGLLNPAR